MKNVRSPLLSLFFIVASAAGAQLSLVHSKLFPLAPEEPPVSFLKDFNYGGDDTVLFCTDNKLQLINARTLESLSVIRGESITGLPGQDGTLYTLHFTSGILQAAKRVSSGDGLWQVTVDTFGDDAVEAAAVASRGGRLFFIVNRERYRFSGNVYYDLFCYALDNATGGFLWKQQLLVPGAQSCAGTALVAADAEETGDAVFVGASISLIGREDDAAIFRLDSSDGTPDWHHVYNGTGNGRDRIHAEGLVCAENGGIVSLMESAGPDGLSDLVIRKIDRGGDEDWTVRFKGGDEAVIPAGIDRDAEGDLYAAATWGTALKDKRLGVAKYKGADGTFLWSSFWQTGFGGPSGAKDICAGTGGVTVAGWAAECLFLSCFIPAAAVFDLEAGQLQKTVLQEDVRGQFFGVESIDDHVLFAGIRYGDEPFSGVPELSLYAINPVGFIRGDSDSDGRITINDCIVLLQYLVYNLPAGCMDALDVNDDGGVNIADAVALLSYLFNEGPEPQPPFPGCGTDSTEDTLSCIEGHTLCF